MARRSPRTDGPGQPPRIDATRGTLVLDRRRFLQLAAASGVAAAGAAAGWRLALAQDDPAAEAVATDVPDIVAAMAAELGHDPERIFRFVADEVSYEPYAGILRGAKGTLVARAGNSADKATLLALLLQAAGIPVRFVSGVLDSAASDELMASAIIDVESARRDAARALVSDDDLAAGIDWTTFNKGVPAETLAQLPDLQEIAEALLANVAEFAPAVETQLQSTIETLTNALATAGIALPTSQTAIPSSERDTHTWVQAAIGPDWLDLDPSFAGIDPGKARAAFAEAFETFPNEWRHAIDFRVIAETLSGGVLTQQAILEASGFADALAQAPVVLSHIPATGLPDIQLLGGLGTGTLYNPVLILGPDAYVGLSSISIGGAGGGGLFGDALGGGGGEGLVEGETGAEWLEISITSPQTASPITTRRAVFDRVGQAMRESGGLDVYAFPPAELHDLGDGQGAQFLPARAVRAFSVSTGPVNLKSLIEQVAKDKLSRPSLLPGVFEAFRHVVAMELAGTMGLRPSGSTPNITSWWLEEQPAGLSEGLDIWHRSFGTMAIPGSGPAAPAAMVAGVLPQVVERVAMGQDLPVDGSAGDAMVSVGAIFDATSSQGVSPTVFSGSLPEDAPYEPEHLDAMQRALDDGWVVVAPGQSVLIGGRPRLGWWLVDPATGATVDQLDSGGGQVEPKVIVNLAALTSIAGTVGWAAFHRATPYLADRKVWDLANKLLTALKQLEGG